MSGDTAGGAAGPAASAPPLADYFRGKRAQEAVTPELGGAGLGAAGAAAAAATLPPLVAAGGASAGLYLSSCAAGDMGKEAGNEMWYHGGGGASGSASGACLPSAPEVPGFPEHLDAEPNERFVPSWAAGPEGKHQQQHPMSPHHNAAVNSANQAHATISQPPQSPPQPPNLRPGPSAPPALLEENGWQQSQQQNQQYPPATPQSWLNNTNITSTSGTLCTPTNLAVPPATPVVQSSPYRNGPHKVKERVAVVLGTVGKLTTSFAERLNGDR